MLKTLKSILTVAVSLSVLTTSAFAGAVEDWAKGEFSLSTLSEKDRIKELKWFQKAAKPFKGMEINVLSETIPTHTYESKTLTKAFEEVTGIKVITNCLEKEKLYRQFKHKCKQEETCMMHILMTLI